MLAVTQMKVRCGCDREVTLMPALPLSYGDEPIVANYECFCGREFSTAINTDNIEGIHINVNDVIVKEVEDLEQQQ